MTPEEFAKKMKEIVKEMKGDTDGLHIEMDRLMIQTLKELGYSKGVNIFLKQKIWYS